MKNNIYANLEAYEIKLGKEESASDNKAISRIATSEFDMNHINHLVFTRWFGNWMWLYISEDEYKSLYSKNEVVFEIAEDEHQKLMGIMENDLKNISTLMLFSRTRNNAEFQIDKYDEVNRKFFLRVKQKWLNEFNIISFR